MRTTESSMLQPTPAHRRGIAGTAWAATTVSALGLLILSVGRIVGAKGFGSSDNDVSTFSSICFFAFVFALLAAVIAGAAAWWTGHRGGVRSGVRTGWLTAGYLLVAIIVAALLNAG